MSDAYYHTRLRWYAYHGGAAKLRGRTAALTECPQLPGLAIRVAEIDYVPECGMWRIREEHSGWRDMESEEARAADLALRILISD